MIPIRRVSFLSDCKLVTTTRFQTDRHFADTIRNFFANLPRKSFWFRWKGGIDGLDYHRRSLRFYESQKMPTSPSTSYFDIAVNAFLEFLQSSISDPKAVYFVPFGDHCWCDMHLRGGKEKVILIELSGHRTLKFNFEIFNETGYFDDCISKSPQVPPRAYAVIEFRDYYVHNDEAFSKYKLRKAWHRLERGIENGTLADDVALADECKDETDEETEEDLPEDETVSRKDTVRIGQLAEECWDDLY